MIDGNQLEGLHLEAVWAAVHMFIYIYPCDNSKALLPLFSLSLPLLRKYPCTHGLNLSNHGG